MLLQLRKSSSLCKNCIYYSDFLFYFLSTKRRCCVDAVTPTDHPKSVRNRCVNEVVGDGFVLSSCVLDSFSVGELSQIYSFFNLCYFPIKYWKKNKKTNCMVQNERCSLFTFFLEKMIIIYYPLLKRSGIFSSRYGGRIL